MRKSTRIILGVIYYLFTFSLGLIIAMVLPTINRDVIMYEYLDKYIEEEDFVKAIDLLGGIYNKESIYEDKENKVIIFETDSLIQITEKNEETETKKTIINASYVCIIKGLEREWFEGNENNKSKVLIDGINTIDILQYDLDEDGNLDTISTLIDNDYICFSIDQAFITEANSLELINAKGEAIFKLDNLGLKFNSDFFNETKEFVEKYNLFYEDNIFSEEENLELKTLFENVNTKNSNYQNSGTYSLDEISKEANKDSIIFVLIYFIWVYILGDFLVGPRYIWRFIKFVFKKIKSKFGEKEPKEDPLALSNNFYCQISFEAEVYEGFDQDIIISYENLKNKDLSFKTIITKSLEYKKTERVRGGSYKLINIECPNHKIDNLIEVLEVKGYKMNIKFNVVKMEENHKEE